MLWLIQLSSFFVGVADCFCFASALSIAGIWDQSGFSLFNFGQSITVSIMTILYIFLDIQYLIIIYFAMFIIATTVLIKHRAKIDHQESP